MKEYEQAISKPYGHFLVDLRVNTPEHERLKQNILNESNPIQDSIPHVEPNVIRASYYQQNSDVRQPLNCQYSVSSSNSSEESDFNLDMPICNDCGIMFGDSHALQQHVKQWCIGRKRKLENGDNTDESEPKKWITLPGDDDSEEDDEIMEANENKKKYLRRCLKEHKKRKNPNGNGNTINTWIKTCRKWMLRKKPMKN
jgi:hypothetical protein